MSARSEAKAFAVSHGYFWAPCPRCGTMFGGHEAGDAAVDCRRRQDTGHMTCPWCVPGDEDEERAACDRKHMLDRVRDIQAAILVARFPELMNRVTGQVLPKENDDAPKS